MYFSLNCIINFWNSIVLFKNYFTITMMKVQRKKNINTKLISLIYTNFNVLIIVYWWNNYQNNSIDARNISLKFNFLCL